MEDDDPMNEAFVLSSQDKTDIVSNLSINNNRELGNKRLKLYLFILFEVLLIIAIIVLTFFLIQKINQNNDLNDEIQNKNIIINNWELKYKQLSNEKKELEINNKNLEQTIEKLELTNSNLNQEIQNNKKEIKNLELANEQLEIEKNQLEKENKEKDSEISELNTKVKTLTTTNNNLNITVSALQLENKSLKEFKNDVEEKIPSITKDENNQTITIEENNLNSTMTSFVNTTATSGYKKYKVSENFTLYLETQVKEKYSGSWKCIAGYQLYNHYDSVKYYINFTIGQISVILLGN